MGCTKKGCQKGASQLLDAWLSDANAAWGHAAYNTLISRRTPCIPGATPRRGGASKSEIAQKLRCAGARVFLQRSLRQFLPTASSLNVYLRHIGLALFVVLL